jgi:hypothetical protein
MTNLFQLFRLTKIEEKMSTILIDLIREQILSETPLMDIIPFKNKRDNSPWADPSAPSIGYNLPSKLRGTEKEKRKQFTDAAKVLLADSEDNWYIIVLKNISGNWGSASKVINNSEFDEWVNSLKIPRRSKIIVPAQVNMTRDYLAPEWQIVHDIIGHTIYEYYATNMRKSFSSERDPENSKIFDLFENYQSLHELMTWTTLPDEFKISKRNKEDRMPDIFAAIFANKFDKQKAISLLNSADEQGEALCNALYKIVEKWKASIPYDKATLVYPF